VPRPRRTSDCGRQHRFSLPAPARGTSSAVRPLVLNCAYKLRTSAYAAQRLARRDGVVALRFTVEKSQQALVRYVLCSLWSDMLEALLILIVLAAAAFPACGPGLCVSVVRCWGLRQGQASKEASRVLAALLGSVSGCRQVAVCAALARPAPDAMRQDGWPPAPYASPPGRPHGGSPYAARRA
jgi:hypothetical protein